VWELADALAAGNRPRALTELGVLLEDGAEPIALIGVLAFKLRQLLEGSLLVREGVGGQDLRRRLRLWGSSAEAFTATCRRSEPAHLVRSLQALREADDAIKSTRVDPRILLERAMLDTLGACPPGA
jgi:DNA polymerase-3 subunit delta